MTPAMSITPADQVWISEHFPALKAKLDEQIASGEFEVISKENEKND
jgi:hypothetical protein